MKAQRCKNVKEFIRRETLKAKKDSSCQSNDFFSLSDLQVLLYSRVFHLYVLHLADALLKSDLQKCIEVYWKTYPHAYSKEKIVFRF